MEAANMPLKLLLLTPGATRASREARFGGDGPLEEKAKGLISPIERFSRAQGLVSPAQAATQTALALVMQAKPDPLLADLDFGAWQGMTLAELARSDPTGLEAWTAQPDFRGHGGESLDELRARVSGWLTLRAADQGRIVAVTHAALIRMMILEVLGAPQSGFWTLDIAPLTVTELRYDGRRWALRSSGCPLT